MRNTGKHLILKGTRQVGKTFILQYFGEQFFKKIHYLNFEKIPTLSKIFDQDLDPTRIIQELSFHLNTKIDLSNDLLIFDEIQSCPTALTSLKYFCEDLPEMYNLFCHSSLAHRFPIDNKKNG